MEGVLVLPLLVMIDLGAVEDDDVADLGADVVRVAGPWMSRMRALLAEAM